MRKEEQKKIQEGKYLLAAVVESSQDSIVTIDLKRIITSWNSGAEHLYGYKATEAIGKSLEMVMLPQDIVKLIENVEKIRNEINVPIYETVRIHKNQKLTDLQIALSPVRDALGNVIGISTIARDITEAKLQEQQKDEFIAVASHELKTPVTSIKAYSEMLVDMLDESGDQSAASIALKLDKQVDRLIDLIKNLLDATKLSAGQIMIKPEEFDLRELCEEQMEGLRNLSSQHEIVFRCDLSWPVFADRNLIGQVLTNLISNAIKYSPDGGRVLVSAKHDDNVTVISVQDFGIGMPEGVSSKIFERYFRVSSEKTKRTPGIGLGLYISAQIVHQHGGEISVTSEEGTGSTFSFSIPDRRNAITEAGKK